MTETEHREPHPLQSFVGAGEAHKKELHHVEVKATKDLLSEVRKGSNLKRESLKHVAPVAKQDLLSAVRTEAGATKKRLSHVEAKNISGLMSELRHHGDKE